ncbi:MAG TPA: hypothetical protein PLV93_10320 [Microthrixaceae bacterium]|nr:hypothetical protein [Microthrixaceae bacterium]
MSASAADGWQPLSGPVRRRLGVDWDAAFPRLAVCHMLSVAGETLVVLSLAGSFFFKVDPSQGREKVILGLLFTMAPFALVGPLIGPLIDRVRGGHRAVIQGTMAMRVVVAVAMMIAVVNDSIALFPEAFAMLVLAKTYQIAKAAVVPTTVAGDLELVEANSKLQLLSGLAAMVAGAVGGVALQIGPEWVLGLTTVVFATASVAAFRLHPSLRGDAEERLAVDEPRRGAADPLPHDLAVAGDGANEGLGIGCDPPPVRDERPAVAGRELGHLRRLDVQLMLEELPEIAWLDRTQRDDVFRPLRFVHVALPPSTRQVT